MVMKGKSMWPTRIILGLLIISDTGKCFVIVCALSLSRKESLIPMVDQEEGIADDGTYTTDEPGSEKNQPRAEMTGNCAKTANAPVKFSESLPDIDKISIYEPSDGKPYPSLRIDPSFKKSLEYKWSNSIILQFVGKCIAFNVLMNKIKILWKLEGEFKFIDIGANCFVFKSDCEATRLKILSEGPWIINGCYLLPRTWKPEFCPSKDKITSTIAWVRILGLPIELYDETVLFGIAKILGRPVELDYSTNWSASGKFARVSVEIDLDKPLKSFVMVEEMIFSVEYENFSVICNECGKIGHRNEHCSVTLLSRTSQNEEGVKEVTPRKEMLINVEKIAPSCGPRMQVGFKRKKIIKSTGNTTRNGNNTSSVLEEEEEGDDSGKDDNYPSEKGEKIKKIKDENHSSTVAINVEASTSFVVPQENNTTTLKSIPSPTKEQEEEDKRRYKSQAHLYTIIKVARDEDLKDQIGKDIYFDLVNLDKVSSFRILKQMPFNLFKEEVAKEVGIPVQYMRFWKWVKRQNLTCRPRWPLTPPEEVQSVAQLLGVSDNTNNAKWNLFLEVEFRDLHPIPYPKKTEEDILLFFKLYDPYKEKLRYVGRLFVKGSATPAEIMPKVNKLAGFSSVDEIELFEEIKFEPNVICERLRKRSSFRLSQIEDGDIICFQKCLPPDAGKQVRFPDVPSYLEYVKRLKTAFL